MPPPLSGHVFHPGHDELHGITVVVGGASGRTYVGRFHERTDGGFIMHDVAIHDPQESSVLRDAWIERQYRFGVAAGVHQLTLPSAEVREVARLSDWSVPRAKS